MKTFKHTGAHPAGRSLARALALLGVGVSLLTALPCAQADDFTANIVPPNSSGSQYQDSDGPGQIWLQTTGGDSATGGSRIGVQIQQNGFRYRGSGFAWRLAQDQFREIDLVVFTLPAGGGVYQFRGVVMKDAQGLHGSGRYADGWTGADVDYWQVD